MKVSGIIKFKNGSSIFFKDCKSMQKDSVEREETLDMSECKSIVQIHLNSKDVSKSKRSNLKYLKRIKHVKRKSLEKISHY